VLLINNLGGISELELGIIVNEAGNWLESNHYNVERSVSR
jgi:dihydroxyacetone kinase